MGMPYNPMEVRVIDSTVTLIQKKEWMLSLRLNLGSKRFADLVQEVQREALPIEEKRETEHKQRLAEGEQKRAIENSLFNRFIKAVKVHHTQPELMQQWKNESHQVIQEILDELIKLEKCRGLTIDSEDQDFAVNFLHTLLSTSPPEPPQHKWINTVKEALK